MQNNRRSGFERRFAESEEVSHNRERRNGAERRSLLRDPDITIGRLRLIPLFKDLSMPQYTKILTICAKTNVNRGDVICKFGEPANTLYLLVSGTIRITSRNRGEFTRSTPKEIIGKIGFFTKTPHTMTVTAESDCTILSISREEFMRVAATEPELWVKILTNLIVQLSEQMQQKAETIRSLNNANSLDIL